jgi:hypothetical protein
MDTTLVRPLAPADRAAWEPLWRGYQEFYRVSIPPEVTDVTWARFHDPAEPMYALGAFLGDRLVGITHYLFHRSCWTLVLPAGSLHRPRAPRPGRRQGADRSGGAGGP